MVDHDAAGHAGAEQEAQSTQADFDRPSIARIYDYHLGGNANFAVDRAAGDELERIFPDQLAYCRHNRAFLGRAVHTLATEHGVDQISPAPWRSSRWASSTSSPSRTGPG
ncbi:SAM-dependent methyltransferase [Bounagaea algeriensis]